MPKQNFHVTDYLGVLAVAGVFASTLFLLSFFVFNFFFVRRCDEYTAFERFGARHNLRLGRRRLSDVKANMHRKRFAQKVTGEADADDIDVAGQSRKPQKIPIVRVDAASNS